MSYLVDGNNVMGQRVGWHRDKPGARRRLLSEMARFARAAGVTVEAVFDGAPEEFFPDGSQFMSVGVHYAARGSDADTCIKQLVEASRERRTLVVVTSDRSLADYVRRCGARVLSSGQFRRRLDETCAEEERSDDEKRAARSPRGEAPAEDLAGWMHYFGVSPEDDEQGEEREGGRESKRQEAKGKGQKGGRARRGLKSR